MTGKLAWKSAIGLLEKIYRLGDSERLLLRRGSLADENLKHSRPHGWYVGFGFLAPQKSMSSHVVQGG